ncbi:hypothetical protein EMCRGX_G004517 [Ephydatia muelleri]
MMIVTLTSYTNSRTLEQLEWPLKYLWKYDCDGDVFSFEAAHNINQGTLKPPSDLDQPNYQNITVGQEVPSLVLASTPQDETKAMQT